MDMKNLKPVPNSILKTIKKRDMKNYPAQDGYHRFYAYLRIWKGELIKITVAVRNHRKNWYCKQVAVHGIHSEECYVKDLEYNYFGLGYRVGWYDEGLQNYRKDYENAEWQSAGHKYYDPYAPIVNLGYLRKLPQYRYSAYKEYRGRDILGYLRIYEKYPQAEHIVKLGLSRYAESVTILRKVAKDKAFRKWLIQNQAALQRWYYYIETVIHAYQSGKPLDDVQRFENRKKCFISERINAPILKLFKGKLLERLFSYLDEKKISVYLYRDYLHACNYLGLDMSLDKNRFPHDFMRWHDERIEQYHTKKFADDEACRKEQAAKMAQEQAELFQKFAVVANKYIALQNCAEDEHYLVLIAKSPAELLNEGDHLNHCVGRMNYKYKFAEEETLIFFVRKLSAPETPFVTMEYSIRQRKILQCYAHDNTKPDEAVLNYVHHKWLPYANKTIKKIAA